MRCDNVSSRSKLSSPSCKNYRHLYLMSPTRAHKAWSRHLVRWTIRLLKPLLLSPFRSSWVASVRSFHTEVSVSAQLYLRFIELNTNRFSRGARCVTRRTMLLRACCRWLETHLSHDSSALMLSRCLVLKCFRVKSYRRRQTHEKIFEFHFWEGAI